MPEKYYPSDPSKVPSFVHEATMSDVPWRPDSLRLLASTPQGRDTNPDPYTIEPSNITEEEIAAAHYTLDALGVPAIADIEVTMEDDREARFATHDLRLHGRIEFLAQRLREIGILSPFEESQARQDTPPSAEQ